MIIQISQSGADALVYPVVILGALLVIGLPFIMRASGTKLHVKSGFIGPSKSTLDFMASRDHEKNIEELKNMDPEIVQQAILNIKNSINANTSDNVLREAKKLNKIKEEGPIDERIKNKFQDFKGKLNFSNTSVGNLEALEKLFNLKEKGVISEVEFEIQKKKILR